MEKLNSNNSWSVFVKTPGNRKRLLLIALVSFFSQCSGNGLVSYYLHSILTSVGVTSSYNQSLINGGLQIWSFLVAALFSLLVDRVGRRRLFMIAAVGMLVTFSIWTGYVHFYSCFANYSTNFLPQMFSCICADRKFICRKCRYRHDLPLLRCCRFRLARLNGRILC